MPTFSFSNKLTKWNSNVSLDTKSCKQTFLAEFKKWSLKLYRLLLFYLGDIMHFFLTMEVFTQTHTKRHFLVPSLSLSVSSHSLSWFHHPFELRKSKEQRRWNHQKQNLKNCFLYTICTQICCCFFSMVSLDNLAWDLEESQGVWKVK